MGSGPTCLMDASTRGTPADPASEVGLASFVLPAVVVLVGVVFMAEALGSELVVVELELNAGWARAVFLAMGVLATYRGGRAILKLATEGNPSAEEIARGWSRTRLQSGGFLVAGLFLVTVLLFDGSLPAIDVERGGWFLWVVAATFLLLALPLIWNPEKIAEQREKLESKRRLHAGEGLRGSAVIRDFDDTGTTINDNPRVRLHLEVMLEGREPYEVERVETVSRLSTGRLLKGETLPVVVDPEDPEELRVLWKEK